jgi:hypothetical protein
MCRGSAASVAAYRAWRLVADPLPNRQPPSISRIIESTWAATILRIAPASAIR